MCLDIIKTHRDQNYSDVIKIAKEDIVCFKLLRYHKKWWTIFIGPMNYYSPYQNSKSPIGKLLIVRNFHENYYNSSTSRKFEINIGFHTFANRSDAEEQKIKMGSSQNILIFESIIPKGSHYYKGTFGRFPKISYCSQKIIYKKKLSNG